MIYTFLFKGGGWLLDRNPGLMNGLTERETKKKCLYVVDDLGPLITSWGISCPLYSNLPVEPWTFRRQLPPLGLCGFTHQPLMMEGMCCSLLFGRAERKGFVASYTRDRMARQGCFIVLNKKTERERERENTSDGSGVEVIFLTADGTLCQNFFLLLLLRFVRSYAFSLD